MTITTGARPRRAPPVALALGFLTGAVAGGALAAVVVGVVVRNAPLCVAGIALPFAYGLLLHLAGLPRRAREAALVPRTALAVIESLDVPENGMTDRPVRFDLTVAPQDGPAFRVEFTQDVHVADLPDYRPGGTLVVRYPPDRPAEVRIVKRPTPEWEERAAGARLDSAPESTRVGEPPAGRAVGFLGGVGLLLAAAGVVLLFRADLAQRDAAEPPSSSSSSSSSTRVVTGGSGSVELGPGRSFLSEGELRSGIDSVTQHGERTTATDLVVQDRLLLVTFAPDDAPDGAFPLSTLPYERFPALVEDARSSLGVHRPQAWNITVSRLGGAVTVTVAVSGPEGSALLLADDRGRVLGRTPALPGTPTTERAGDGR
ncbi:DUF3592 domain-containing protein [Kitasatospora sp. NPDC018619]|uniref:DUF3592 domain-containing protein n=1 Tax=unclassified Kitasatospora TaxID=2633591 RepID=UPI00379C5F8C